MDHTPYDQSEMHLYVPEPLWSRVKARVKESYNFDVDVPMEGTAWVKYGFPWTWTAVRQVYAELLLDICTASVVQALREDIRLAVLFDILTQTYRPEHGVFPLDMQVGPELTDRIWCALKQIP